MAKVNLSLQPSEVAVAHCASRIYAAYIATGRVTEGHEEEWLKRSIKEATQIAVWVDEAIQSDEELG